MRRILLAAITILFVASSSAPAKAGGAGDVIGTLLGAGAGAFLGNQIGHGVGREAATIGGALLGGYLGHRAGSSFDHVYYGQPTYYDTYYVQPAYYPAEYRPNYVAPDAPPPQAITPQYVAYQQPDCREYKQLLDIGGQVVEHSGIACQTPDGNWQVVQ